jgi:hypothetical protein
MALEELEVEIRKTLYANHKSFAGSAMQSRVDLINQTIDKKISLFVIDKENQAGTTVVISFAHK